MRWCVEYRPGGGGRGVAKKRLALALDQRPDPGASPKKPAACSAHGSWDNS